LIWLSPDRLKRLDGLFWQVGVLRPGRRLPDRLKRLDGLFWRVGVLRPGRRLVGLGLGWRLRLA